MESIITNYTIMGATFALLSFIVLSVLCVILGVSQRKSEERLNRANIMVQQCTDAVKELSHTAAVNMESFDKVTETFVTQIKYLQQQRDELTAQNHDLIHTNDELTSILSMKKDQTINFNNQAKPLS